MLEDFLTKSPGLNSIEVLWVIIKIRLNQFGIPSEEILRLWKRVEQIWNEINKKSFR